MVSMLFRDPQALSSALASLGTLQPRAFRSLNRIETLDSASNYYVETSAKVVQQTLLSCLQRIFVFSIQVLQLRWLSLQLSV